MSVKEGTDDDEEAPLPLVVVEGRLLPLPLLLPLPPAVDCFLLLDQAADRAIEHRSGT